MSNGEEPAAGSGAAVDESEDRTRRLSAAAQRALAEAEERRRRREQADPGPREVGGRKGPEPVRYGDWEVNGRAIDF